MGCPYTDEQLQFWDGVTNPMGEACHDCEDYDCEHNPNPNGEFEPPDGYDDNFQDPDVPDDTPREDEQKS